MRENLTGMSARKTRNCRMRAFYLYESCSRFDFPGLNDEVPALGISAKAMALLIEGGKPYERHTKLYVTKSFLIRRELYSRPDASL